MSYLVANPEDRFSRDEAHMIVVKISPGIMKLGSKYDLLDTPCILKYRQIV